MAGAGFKDFANGDVLSADQVDTYLMQQTVMVFADASARTTALSGVLAEGMVSYLKDTNAMEYYTGSAWATVGGGGATGKVLQVVSTTKTDTFTSTSTTAVDITGLSVSITPSASTSKVMVFVNIMGNGQNASNGGMFLLKRDSTSIAYPTSAGSRAAGFGSIYINDAAQTGSTGTNFLDSPASTSALTYKVQGFATSGGSFVVNRSNADTDNNSYTRGVSTITVMEIAA